MLRRSPNGFSCAPHQLLLSGDEGFCRNKEIGFCMARLRCWLIQFLGFSYMLWQHIQRR